MSFEAGTSGIESTLVTSLVCDGIDVSYIVSSEDIDAEAMSMVSSSNLAWAATMGLDDFIDLSVDPILCGMVSVGNAKFDTSVFGVLAPLVVLGIGNVGMLSSGMLTVVFAVVGAVVSACVVYLIRILV